METYWQEKYGVRSYDVDFHGEATLGAMCRFMQEVAGAHAETIGVGFEALTSKGMAWVLARQRIEIDRMPGVGETVTARTWPSGKDRLFFYRDFHFAAADGRTLLRATTAWFVIAIATRERQPAEAFIDELFPMGEPQFENRPARLRPQSGGGAGPVFPVRYGDLDVNDHVNNVRYLEWLLDGLPIEFHRGNRLRSIDVNYLAETLPGDAVRIVNAESGDGTLSHRIVCDERNLVLAQTSWDAG
jgi:acyl-ACP thioesterase